MPANEILLNVLFYAFALVALGGALAVALSRNIVRSAFSLLAVLLAAAALYALMKADFLAAIQVLVYVGGIMVLIVFAIMLTHKIADVKISNESTPGPAALLTVTAVLFVLCGLILSYPGWEVADISDEALSGKYRDVAGEIEKDIGAAAETPMEPESLTELLGIGLMTRYLLPFEAVSLLLLAALIGAALLARKEVRR